MKRIFLILAIIIFLLPSIQKAEEYEPEGWCKFGLLEGGVGIPVLIYIKTVPLSIGYYSPPHSIGFGTAIWELSLIPVDFYHANFFSTPFPIYFYWAPFIKWKKKWGITFSSSAFYFFLGFSAWGRTGEGQATMVRTGIGAHYSFLPLFSIGIEAGFIGGSPFQNGKAGGIPFVFIKFADFPWFGIGSKK